MVLWFYVQEHPKAQQAVALVLKYLRRWGHSLKCHPTYWEKMGIEPATPGLQDVGLSPTPQPVLVFFLNCSKTCRDVQYSPCITHLIITRIWI